MTQSNTFANLVSKILEILPNATFGDDNEGQIIVYTNYRFLHDLTMEETDEIIEYDPT